MEFKERKRWPFLGLPFTFTVYTLTEEIITIDAGFLKHSQNDCYMYKVADVALETSLIERIFKLGTVVCNTSDTTHPKLVLAHIRNAKTIKNFILQKSEEERLKRRTLNTQNIGASPHIDCDFDIHGDHF